MSKEKLFEMMELQEKFNSEIVPKHESYWRIMNPFFSKEECIERVKNEDVPILSRLYMYLFHLEIELTEMIRNMPNKMWKHEEINWDELRKEFVDCLHFYLSLYSYSDKVKPLCKIEEGWNKNFEKFEENDYEKVLLKTYHEIKYDIFQIADDIMVNIETGNFEIEKMLYHDFDRITARMRDFAELLFVDFDDLYSEYIKKMNINKDRQKNNY